MDSRDFSSLHSLFKKHDIDTSKPGFYDDRAFVREESKDYTFLEKYGEFVEGRPYDEAYIARARAEIPVIARLVWEELVKDGRLGACIDIGMVLSRILEEEGFWNYMIKGSLTMTFPKSSGVTPRYFWSWDVVERPFAAAHAWIVAPPFAVVDVSLKQQPFKRGQGHEYLPDFVVAEHVSVSVPDPKDIFSPDFLMVTGTPLNKAIAEVEPRLSGFLKKFPPITITIDDLMLKYTRVAVSAPDNPFPKMDGWPVNGRIGIEFYKDVVRPNLEQLRSGVRT